jgi:hypothetical protein
MNSWHEEAKKFTIPDADHQCVKISEVNVPFQVSYPLADQKHRKWNHEMISV